MRPHAKYLESENEGEKIESESVGAGTPYLRVHIVVPVGVFEIAFLPFLPKMLMISLRYIKYGKKDIKGNGTVT